MKTITELNKGNFASTITTANMPVVVDFYAPWCGPCKMLSPVLDALAEKFQARIQFFKVNVDLAPELAERFDITGVPTLLFFKDGQVVDTVVGMPSPKVLLSRLEQLPSPVSTTEAG